LWNSLPSSVRIVAKELKSSSQFSNNILTKKIIINKDKKGKARKSKGRGISIWIRKMRR
jgi:hypothetical protein